MLTSDGQMAKSLGVKPSTPCVEFADEAGMRREAKRVLGKRLSRKAYILHRCDNRLCAAPDHLQWGTQSDNMLDASFKGRLPGCKQKQAAEVAWELLRVEFVLSQIQSGG